GFLDRPSRDLIGALRALGGLTELGEALVAVLLDEDGRPVPIAVKEEVRLAILLDFPAAQPYEPEVTGMLRGSPRLRGRAAAICEVIAAALELEAGASVEPVLALIWALFGPAEPAEMVAVRDAFRALFADLARKSRSPYRETFERLRDELGGA